MADLVRIAPVDTGYNGNDVEEGFNHDDTDIKNLYSVATRQRGLFYGTVPPSQPNVGDKWHNSTTGFITFWDGDSWDPVNSADADTVGGHEPGVEAGNVLVLDSNARVPLANSGIVPFSMMLWPYALGGTGNKFPVYDSVIYTNWHVCDGTDGTVDMRGIFPLGVNTDHALATTGGAETVTLTANQIPSHAHENGTWNVFDMTTPKFGTVASASIGNPAARYAGGGPAMAYTHATGTAGGGESHNNMPPFKAIYFIQRIS